MPRTANNSEELKVKGWTSGYFSVGNVLRHLQRKAMGYGAPSYSSVELYVAILAQFCRFAGKDPAQLVALPKVEIEELVHSYLDQSLARGLSRKTVKTRRSYLLLHFRKNGFKGERALDIEVYSVPARYRKVPEHIPSSEEVLRMADAALSVRDRAVILCVYTSGLRDSTFRALRYKDVKEDLGNDTVLVPVYPEMKRVIDRACKNNIPYFTFFDPLSTEALRAYLRDRERRFGPIGDEEVLFPPGAGASHLARYRSRVKPLGDVDLGRVMKKAAQNAGIKEWKQIHPHALRKSFEEGVKRRRPDGTMMGEKDQEFLMGHILPGSQDPYYGSGISVEGSTISFSREVANKLREEYRMLQFFPERNLISKDETLAIFNRRFLKMSNWTDEEIEALGDLSAIEESRLQELLDQKSMRKLGLNGNRQKVVQMGEVKRFIEEGWEYLSTLPSGEAIVRLPAG
ncbi:MAG TPA: tyrosine-type recombinase/integrase [Nitrososphaerales archaeon]|nr:tyrosine-type recombinase/integrase [Nitrososphaerales archaeon]